MKQNIVKTLPASCRGSKSKLPPEKTVTLPVVWLPEAQAELMEALAHYDAVRPELGERLANAVVETAEAIASMPLPLPRSIRDGGGLACVGFLMACSSSWRKRASS